VKILLDFVNRLGYFNFLISLSSERFNLAKYFKIDEGKTI